MVQKPYLIGRTFNKLVNDILISQEVGPFDSIPRMKVQGISIFLRHNGSGTAFSAYRMGTLYLDF
jgi:hypothetical protein